MLNLVVRKETTRLLKVNAALLFKWLLLHFNKYIMFNNILDIKSRSSGRPGVPPSVLGEKSVQTNKSLTLLWGATGEQEWTPALTTGELKIIG